MHTEGAPSHQRGRSFGVYVHIPFCSVRCGYCDFNTYTASELGEGVSRATFAQTVLTEIDQAAGQLGSRPVDSVFFGGGTPTQLESADLVAILDHIDARFGLAPGAEVTTEANPDSVSPESLSRLREGGFNRVSFGVQSAVPHVLAMLDRTHNPDNVPLAFGWARAAGFEQVSADLIYGTPGESMDDWRTTLESVIGLEPDHVSAYALIVESGTAFARRVRRGEVVMPDDDETADKYLLADELLEGAGLHWYELSNWSRDDAARCSHNLGYWHSGDWWGTGPGAHSHVAGERWWNVKHPAVYASRLNAGDSPRADGETIDEATAHLEDVMLRTRLRQGIELDVIDRARVDELVSRGLVDLQSQRLVLTREGRLLADAVVRELT